MDVLRRMLNKQSWKLQQQNTHSILESQKHTLAIAHKF